MIISFDALSTCDRQTHCLQLSRAVAQLRNKNKTSVIAQIQLTLKAEVYMSVVVTLDVCQDFV